MTLRDRAVSRGSRWFAVALAAVFVCSAASVALASSGAVLTSQYGSLGQMVVGRNLHTLYLFHQDTSEKSYCYGACAATWTPDITYGSPTVASGSNLDSKLLGTIRRRNGTKQVTYNGHPLYFYKGDKQSGTMNGEGKKMFGGPWYAVGIKGRALKPFNPPGY